MSKVSTRTHTHADTRRKEDENEEKMSSTWYKFLWTFERLEIETRKCKKDKNRREHVMQSFKVEYDNDKLYGEP